MVEETVLRTRNSPRRTRSGVSTLGQSGLGHADPQTLSRRMADVIHRGEQSSKPQKSAKTIAANLECRFFADTRVTAYRLAARFTRQSKPELGSAPSACGRAFASPSAPPDTSMTRPCPVFCALAHRRTAIHEVMSRVWARQPVSQTYLTPTHLPDQPGRVLVRSAGVGATAAPHRLLAPSPAPASPPIRGPVWLRTEGLSPAVPAPRGA